MHPFAGTVHCQWNIVQPIIFVFFELYSSLYCKQCCGTGAGAGTGTAGTVSFLTQEEPEPEPYPCSRFRFRLRFLLQKKSNYIYSAGTLADTCMKLAREETKIKVTGKSFYRKNNLKFEGMNRNRNWNRNRSRNRGQKIWDPEPEPEPRQNGTVPQH
jgi:hypothetical protein